MYVLRFPACGWTGYFFVSAILMKLYLALNMKRVSLALASFLFTIQP